LFDHAILHKYMQRYYLWVPVLSRQFCLQAPEAGARLSPATWRR
jgi:hypothetical protein